MIARHCSCGHDITTAERAETLRQWAELHLCVYECPRCGTTVSEPVQTIRIYTREQYAERARLLASARGWADVTRRLIDSGAIAGVEAQL